MAHEFIQGPRIVASRRMRLSPWVTLIENSVKFDLYGGIDIYHSIETFDSVAILALAEGRRAIIVRQYRPALNRTTLELPGGLLEEGEEPCACVVRELAEETGYAVEQTEPLGAYYIDSGRTNARMWAFFSPAAKPIAGWQPEPGILVDLIGLDCLRTQVCDGVFDHGPHLALLGLAIVRGLIS